VNDRKDLAAKIITEAIILDGAEPRRTLLSVPTAFAAVGGMSGYNALLLTPEASRGLSPIQFTPVLATSGRDYTMIVQNDMFHGPLPLRPPSVFEKIADISNEVDKPIAPVKVRLAGDSAERQDRARSQGGRQGASRRLGEDRSGDQTITLTPARARPAAPR